ncbi:MAG: hypothetical protein ACK4NA_14350 [Alphaproteobacteria bacterium]
MALAACGDPPSPFQHQTPFSNPLLKPGLRAGLIVAPVATPNHDEVPGDVIADAVVLALRDADIPALTPAEAAAGARAARRPSRPTLAGTLAQTRENGPLRLDWRLVGVDGREIAAFVSEPRATAADWQSLSPALRTAIAADVVRGVERHLDEAEGIPPDVGELPRVTIAGVDGVPGAGPQAMARALEYHLKQAGLTVGDSIAENGAIVMGAIEIAPAARAAAMGGGPPEDNLKVSWTVLRPDGREIGVISQANDVPRAALAGAWGDLAFLIAEAATPGIIDLLQQMVQADAAARLNPVSR